MITSLLDRRVKSRYSDEFGGFIRGVFMDRGIMQIILENPDGLLSIQHLESVYVEKQDDVDRLVR